MPSPATMLRNTISGNATKGQVIRRQNVKVDGTTPVSYDDFGNPVETEMKTTTTNIPVWRERSSGRGKHEPEGVGGHLRQVVYVPGGTVISASYRGYPDYLLLYDENGGTARQRVIEVEDICHPFYPRLGLKRVTVEAETNLGAP
jgi:hypothetical protein